MVRKIKVRPVATVAILLVAGNIAHAEDVGQLKREAVALREENAKLEARLSRLERRAAPEKHMESAGSAPAAPESFLSQILKAPPAIVGGDGPLTWNGITLYGVIDAGMGWQSHGFPPNGNMYAAPVLITKNNNRAYFGPLPNGLSQSTIGLKGEQEILPGLAGVFNAAAGFVPTSGQLANAPMSLINHNGLSRFNYSNNADGSRGGQAFNDQLNAGLSSKTFGTLTFGRHRTFAADTVISYDPAGASYAFSVIGISGAAAGGGYTEDVRWDDSLKYKVIYGLIHLGAMYKFADGNGGSNVGNSHVSAINFPPHNDAYQFSLGGDYAGVSLDAVAGHYNQAISASPLSAAQLAGTSNFIGNDNVVKTTTGNANWNTLAGTVTDNTNVMVAASYSYAQFKFFAGYEHVLLSNPKSPLGVGGQVQGGYALSSVNNHALGSNKSVNYFWTGLKYAYNPQLDLTLGYYHILQNAYVGAVAGLAKVVASCRDTSAPNCSGTLDAVGFNADYHFNKRFDVYAGVMWSSVTHGLASGYLYDVEWAPSAGVRYTF